MFKIREARPGDESGIHEAQMRSIRELCSRDYTPEEIRVWGNRPLGTRWTNAIKAGFVWVIEDEHKIYGCAYLRTSEEASEKRAYVDCLYLSPEVIGQGFGRKLTLIMIEKAKDFGALSITLDSTLTAHNFYKKLGFVDTGPMKLVQIGDSKIRSLPMQMKL